MDRLTYINSSINKLADLHDKLPGSKLSVPYKEFLDAAINQEIESYHTFKKFLNKQLGSDVISPEDFFEFAEEVLGEEDKDKLSKFKSSLMASYEDINGIEETPSGSVNTMSILQKPWLSSTFAG